MSAVFYQMVKYGRPGRQQFTEIYQIDDLANRQKITTDNIHEKDGLTNRSGIVSTKENAASSAKDSGVKSAYEAAKLPAQDTPKRGRSAMSKWAKSEHKKVARCIGYALTLGDEAAWHGLTIVLMARLSDEERAALAFAALMSLSDDHASAVAEVAA